jgi:hypothetical protein
MATEHSTNKRRALLWVGLGGCLLVVLLCVGGLLIVGLTGGIWVSSPQPINITDVVLSTGVNDQGRPVDNVTRFAPTASRVYCTVQVSAPKPVHVGVRWYYQDALILDQAQTVDQIGHWMLYRDDGNPFDKGQYRVEVYLVERPSRTIYFTVGP